MTKETIKKLEHIVKQARLLLDKSVSENYIDDKTTRTKLNYAIYDLSQIENRLTHLTTTNI
jgi:hypothetical protein